ncbi:MAG TPA: wax ester/triacylglycerol synthase domain-containing protein [Streptosporangiaceae bacterium]|nr:wax ester/triacylglycerol synthase domain-containing protein [Streptosporangiaceae bacterium]
MPADQDPGAERLSREDLSILALENETVAGHTGKVILLHGSLDTGQLRAALGGRLHRAPRLSLRLAEIAGVPWWVPDPDLDLDYHVVESSPAGAADDAAFRAWVAAIFARHLDRSRPLWRIDVLPGLAAGRSALVWRIHHALADGMTAMRMASAVLWDEGPVIAPRAARPHRPLAGAAGRGGGGAGGGAHPFGDLMSAAREVPQPWLRSPFDGHIDARRSVAFSTAGLDGLRRVSRATGGATVNDAVLTVVSGGLRRWLEAHHGHLGPVRVKVPVSLHGPPPGHGHGHDAARPGNRDSFFCVDLPLGPPDPLDRLAVIQHATRVRKRGHDAQHLDALMRELAHVPQLSHFAERALSHARSFALNVSNVPGPRQPVHVLGRPVQAMYSLAEIGEHHALRIAVVSLAGTLNFGLVADPTLLSDVDQLAAGLDAEAAALTACLPPG